MGDDFRIPGDIYLDIAYNGIDNGSELEIGEVIFNSARICYIHLSAYSPGKGAPPVHQSIYSFISICISK